MKRRLGIGLLALLAGLAVAAADQQQDAAQRDAAVRQTLDSFWNSFLRGDPTGLRLQVDLPLTLLQPGRGEEPGERIVVTPNAWSDFRRGFPPTPLPAEQVAYELANLRLEWLDEQTCLAVYELLVTIQKETTGGRLMTVLNAADGWKVTVSSVPL
ncbi:MAG: hypothetical protein IT204_10535 [Fimbriimonadaceae bacterium]|nr:hypothetical protein [Fimbriimonadaceae bacterium]